jgi:hypothetical protein
MRWNETCDLVAKEYGTDDEGVTTAVETITTVFCNARTVGASTWSSMYEIGISADAQVQVRTCDYAEQRDAVYRGRRYSIEVVEERGDFTVLTMRRQQSDAPEPVAEPETEPEPGEEPGTEPEPEGGEGTDG